MDSEKFSDVLCHLNTTTNKYLKVKTAYKLINENPSNLGREIVQTVLDVLGEKMVEHEKEIIEQATKLTE